MSGGRRGAAGWPPSRRTRPFSLVGWATGSPCGDAGVSACPLGAVAASYAPGGQPARHTCHRDPARPARSASTPRGPPRYSAGCRRPRLPSLARVAAAAAAWPMWRSRASERACQAGRSKFFFFAGWWAARLEQEARSRAWLCPPRRHKHDSGPLRRLAATCSARSLPPACVRMAFACSAAHGGVATATRPVAFSGRLRGVLAGARGTWAGVVLGHKTAVLEVMPQVGQPPTVLASRAFSSFDN